MLRQAQHERVWREDPSPMIDNFALGLSHGLMLLAAWLLLRRPDLDREHGPKDVDRGDDVETKRRA